jgi:signal transduction histidine kinase
MTRRVWLTDTALALVIGFLQVVGSNFAAEHQPSAHKMDLLANLLLGLGPFALIWRRRHPIPVLGVVFVVTFAYRMIDYAQGPLWLALIVAFFTEVIFGPRWVSWVTVAAGYVALLWGPALAGRESTPSAAAAAGVAAWVLVLLAVSTGLSLRRERRAERREAQESESRRLVSDERLRIARELHDVLAHNISLINVQAGVALHLIDEHPEQGKIALQTIKDASKDTLRELRSVLGVLRQVDEDLPLAPAPSLERLDELLDRAEAVGMTVHAERTGEPRPLPAGVDLAGYRILQESLTNVAKHAGPATVTITLVYGVRELSISIEDDGTGGAGGRESPTPGGNGIAGMRERATALGGSLHVGRRPGGGYQVKAVLPLGGER